jgi:ADP-heptose:LPS heptosyltransferase
VIVTGGPDEVGLANQVAAGAALMPERVFAGRVSTLDLAALVAAGRGVVTSDSGMVQLAAAMGKPWLRPQLGAHARVVAPVALTVVTPAS